MTEQARHHSFIEAVLNVASGFVIASLVWAWVVQPVWDIDTTLSENLQITLMFTLISVVRGYVWRRLGNWWTHRHD